MTKYGFFQDDNGNKSMARLLVCGTFIVASISLFRVKDDASIIAITSLMLTAFVIQYGLSKTNETISKFSNQGIKNDTNSSGQ